VHFQRRTSYRGLPAPRCPTAHPKRDKPLHLAAILLANHHLAARPLAAIFWFLPRQATPAPSPTRRLCCPPPGLILRASGAPETQARPAGPWHPPQQAPGCASCIIISRRSSSARGRK
jgi:hypothetical protein